MSHLSAALKESWHLVEDRQDRVAAYFSARQAGTGQLTTIRAPPATSS